MEVIKPALLNYNGIFKTSVQLPTTSETENADWKYGLEIFGILFSIRTKNLKSQINGLFPKAYFYASRKAVYFGENGMHLNAVMYRVRLIIAIIDGFLSRFSFLTPLISAGIIHLHGRAKRARFISIVKNNFDAWFRQAPSMWAEE